MKKAIATAPGQPTLYVDLTTKELTEYNKRKNAPSLQPDVNTVLESAFLQLIPNHQGGSYLTGSVKAIVWGSKTAVMEAVKAGELTDAKDIIESLRLPTEMQADQASLVTLLNSLIGDE